MFVVFASTKVYSSEIEKFDFIYLILKFFCRNVCRFVRICRNVK